MNHWPMRRNWRVMMLIVLAIGLICFGFGIIAPMMTVKKLVLVKNTFSVLGGIGELLADKTIALGLILLFFSVFFPLVKFVLMIAYVVIYPPLPGVLVHWQRWLGKVAKFSMLDVFVVAQLLMILKLGWLVEVEIHSGIYGFSAAVLISMLTGLAIERDIRIRLQHDVH